MLKQDIAPLRGQQADRLKAQPSTSPGYIAMKSDQVISILTPELALSLVPVKFANFYLIPLDNVKNCDNGETSFSIRLRLKHTLLHKLF